MNTDISPKGQLNKKEVDRSRRDALLNIVNGFITVAITALITYLSGAEFKDALSDIGVASTFIIFVVNSYLIPFLNRKLNIFRV